MGLDPNVAALALSALWSADLRSHIPNVQPMSGVPVRVLLIGMLATNFLAFGPHWLATHFDRRHMPGVAPP